MTVEVIRLGGLEVFLVPDNAIAILGKSMFPNPDLGYSYLKQCVVTAPTPLLTYLQNDLL